MTISGRFVAPDEDPQLFDGQITVRVLSRGKAIVETAEPLDVDPAQEGRFSATLFSGFVPCAPIPDPEQVEITLVLTDCEQRFVINVDGQSAVFDPDESGALPGNPAAIDLLQPITVPPCSGANKGG